MLAAAAALIAIGCAARLPPGGTARDGSATGSRTVLDGVYTEEQSLRGETVYFSTCVLCHRPEMTGTEIVPPLIGERFLNRWDRRTVGDLFELMRTTMPPVITSRRTRQEYADVLAYILNRNRFPAGSRELASEFAALDAIRMASGQ